MQNTPSNNMGNSLKKKQKKSGPKTAALVQPTPPHQSEPLHAPDTVQVLSKTPAESPDLQASSKPLPAATTVQTIAITETAPEALPIQVIYAHANQDWQAMEEAVVGLAHRMQNKPCQDATKASIKPRPCLVLADGAGSSAVSEIGARTVVVGLLRLADTLNNVLAEKLDSEKDDDEGIRSLGLVFVKHAKGLLADLSVEHRRDIRDFRSTLLLFITGQKRHMWLKVGDGALVVERQLLTADQPAQSNLTTLGHGGKGEFANQTQFLDEVQIADVQTGYLSAKDITGIALMSDGAAERLVSNDGNAVSPRIGKLLQDLREKKLRRTKLTRMFYEDGFCEGTSGDDRAIALLSTTFKMHSQEYGDS